jgi:hypothetical protein
VGSTREIVGGIVVATVLAGAAPYAMAAGTSGTVVDTQNVAVGVAHCEEEDVSRNGARTAQLTGVIDVTGAVASVSITCKVIQGGVARLQTQLSLPGNAAVAPTKTGTIGTSGYLVCGYGSYQPVLGTKPIAVSFRENPSGCP